MRNHAELLREAGKYADVRVAFLKEEPLIESCLDGLQTEQVVIVPDFLAEGYFTRRVIPRILNLPERNNNIQYCPPVGTHPMMAELLQNAAESVARDWKPRDTSLLVVGHGSGKNPCSKQTLLHHLAAVRQSSHWAQVEDLWLEESPRVGEWRQVSAKPQVIVVPYLLNDGQHGGWDIPDDLGVDKNSPVHGVTHELQGCMIRIAPALGTSTRFVDAIAGIAEIWG